MPPCVVDTFVHIWPRLTIVRSCWCSRRHLKPERGAMNGRNTLPSIARNLQTGRSAISSTSRLLFFDMENKRFRAFIHIERFLLKGSRRTFMLGHVKALKMTAIRYPFFPCFCFAKKPCNGTTRYYSSPTKTKQICPLLSDVQGWPTQSNLDAAEKNGAKTSRDRYGMNESTCGSGMWGRGRRRYHRTYQTTNRLNT